MRTLCAPLLLLVLLPGLARAEPPAPARPLTPVPAGADVILTLKTGQPAPADGQFFDTPTALRWGNYLQQCKTRLTLDPLYQYKLDQADLTASQKLGEAQKQEYTQMNEALQARLDALSKAMSDPPFYKTFWFGAVVGVVSAAVLVGGSVALLNAVK